MNERLDRTDLVRIWRDTCDTICGAVGCDVCPGRIGSTRFSIMPWCVKDHDDKSYIDRSRSGEPTVGGGVGLWMPTTESAKLYGHWLGLWNGELAIAESIVAPDCVIHHPNLPSPTTDQRSGVERIVAMVREGRAPFHKLVFSLDVGPIEEGDKLAARWTCRGNYAGEFPGAHAPAGTTVIFSGADIFRLRDGKIAEYWASSDALQLMQQLNAVPAASDK